MPRIFLTHPPEALQTYYGAHALAALEVLAPVRLNPAGRELTTAELMDAARGCEIIVSHRGVAAGPELFGSLPDLVAFCRCAVDIRTVNVLAASGNGVLVTHAISGFVASVAEWGVREILKGRVPKGAVKLDRATRLAQLRGDQSAEGGR